MRHPIASCLVACALVVLVAARPAQAAKKLGGKVDAADVHITSSPPLAYLQKK